jgi:hypothetical protein
MKDFVKVESSQAMLPTELVDQVLINLFISFRFQKGEVP